MSLFQTNHFSYFKWFYDSGSDNMKFDSVSEIAIKTMASLNSITTPFVKLHVQRCKKWDIREIYLCYIFLASANFWAILGHFLVILGHFWAIFGNFGSFLGHFWSFWAIFGHFGSFLAILGNFWHFLVHFRPY